MNKHGDDPAGQIERIRNLESCVRTLTLVVQKYIEGGVPDPEGEVKAQELAKLSFILSALED